jgi:hypothetical protein
MSEHCLSVEASDETAEIAVLDAKQNKVLAGLGRVDGMLSAGLYEAQVRLGPVFREQLIALDQNKNIVYSAPDLQFPTPVPLTNTARTRPYHEQAAVEASKMGGVGRGSGATILVFARDWTQDESSTGHPLLGLSLHDMNGELLPDLTKEADFRQTNGAGLCQRRDVSEANLISVVPGAYRLRLKLADHKSYDRIIVAVGGWQTQVFMFRRDYSDPGKTPDVRADLANGLVVMARHGADGRASFDPNGRGERAAVMARYALVQRRPLADAVYQELYKLKFNDPILGLLAAHLLLRDKQKETRLLDEVMSNLHNLLGTGHPDLAALELRRGSPSDQQLPGLATPPMLKASWDCIVEESVTKPSIVPENQLYNGVQAGIVPSEPWLIWRSDDGAHATLNEQLEALRSFVAASEPLKPDLPTSLSSPTLHADTNQYFSVEPTPRARGLTAGANEIKVELARSLGVTGNRLNAMLSGTLDSTPAPNRTDGLTP